MPGPAQRVVLGVSGQPRLTGVLVFVSKRPHRAPQTVVQHLALEQVVLVTIPVAGGGEQTVGVVVLDGGLAVGGIARVRAANDLSGTIQQIDVGVVLDRTVTHTGNGPIGVFTINRPAQMIIKLRVGDVAQGVSCAGRKGVACLPNPGKLKRS